MEKKVIICRQPDHYKKSEISIDKITNLRWDFVSGGVHAKFGYYCLCGYIDYNLAVSLVKCSGHHRFGNNVAKIFIPFGINNIAPYKSGYIYLAEMAGEKPPSIISQNRPLGAPPCTKAILNEVEKRQEISRGEMRNILLKMGYKPTTILSAFRSLTKNKNLLFIGSPNSKNQLIKINNSEL